MSFEKRLEKNIAKKEKAIEKEKEQIVTLKEKLNSGKLTRAKYNIQKKKIEAKVREMSSRMRVLQGILAKEKRHQIEKEEEKKNKEKDKKKKK